MKHRKVVPMDDDFLQVQESRRRKQAREKKQKADEKVRLSMAMSQRESENFGNNPS